MTRRRTANLTQEEFNDLRRRCMEGTADAHREFIRQFESLIWRAVQSRLPWASAQDQEEVVANTFISLLANNAAVLGRYNSALGRKYTSYIHHQAVLQCINRFRLMDAHKRRREITVDFHSSVVANSRADSAPSPEQQAMKRQELIALRKSFEELLSPALRITYQLMFVQEMKAPKAAETLGVSLEVVYTRKKRIVDALQKAMAEEAALAVSS